MFLRNPQVSKSVTLSPAWLNAGDWKLIPGPLMILLKLQYNKIWPFLIVEIQHFKMSFIHLSKKNKIKK